MNSRLGYIQNEMNHHISGAFLSWHTKKTACSEKRHGYHQAVRASNLLLQRWRGMGPWPIASSSAVWEMHTNSTARDLAWMHMGVLQGSPVTLRGRVIAQRERA